MTVPAGAAAGAAAGQAALLAMARRTLGAASPRALVSGAGGAPMEVARDARDEARLSPARVIEGDTVRAHRVAGEPDATFGAFLDGIQRTERVGYLDAAPIVLGSVAAVVRERHEGRLRTWGGGFARETRVYLPLALLPADVPAQFEERGFAIADTLAGRRDRAVDRSAGPHPLELERAACDAIREHRGAMERRLADAWVERGPGALCVDGPLPGDAASRSPAVTGVVKSHRELQVAGEALRVVLALAAGERSSVLERTSATRVSVATWYLRLRDPAGRHPLWGLVRVEAAHAPGGDGVALAARADAVSRMVLAESRPLALPDSRWDVMVYPIRDCEEFLRASL
ncbi:MAG: hypothetical protein HYX65_11110 [Gemmatimonadetes bacterium]|nr:hypothetical protein [Gemmatimonadota bacterium]